MLVSFDGKKLHAARKKQSLSQAGIAERADTSIRYVRDLEKGKKDNPSAVMVCRFSTVLGIQMEDLMEIKEGDEG